MNLGSRIGPQSADVVLFSKGGRDFRLERLSRGEEVPREFFYGQFAMEEVGIQTAMMRTSGAVSGVFGTLADKIERAFGAATALGVRPLSVRLQAPLLSSAKVLMSFTDGFSLSLGLGFPRRAGTPILIGGFHGVSDIECRAPTAAARLVRLLITRCLAGLDHAFFFGAADRQVAIDRYGLSDEKSSVIPFGVDAEYWRPVRDGLHGDFVVAVGQDLNRDYDLLAMAPGANPTRIITRRPVKFPNGAKHITIGPGEFFQSDAITDADLRSLYNAAFAVVVPLKDVHQPSGYSVTLQAMSCGRPVILSKTKGLWSELLRNEDNCLLVPPGDARALGQAITAVRSNPDLSNRLGHAARKTVLQHFGLDQINEGSVALARLGLRLHAERTTGSTMAEACNA
jgi:glycosyltransferase involved in cell wall biosynthesis